MAKAEAPKAIVHFHESGAKGWACGATMGPATGDHACVTCDACKATPAFTKAADDLTKAEEDHAALSLPPAKKSAEVPLPPGDDPHAE
jgi:hypothetical protein